MSSSEMTNLDMTTEQTGAVHPDELLRLIGEQATSADEREFAERALAFLREHVGLRQPIESAWGSGPERLELFHETTDEEERREADAALAWQATKFAAGFGWIAGPAEHGGAGLPSSYDRLFRVLESQFDVPDPSPIRIGVGTVGPTLVRFGIPEVVEHYARPLYQGRSIACQLFSEPGAGSDLAGVSTQATPTESGWRVNGQKVWTSNAAFADFGLALVRTDPALPRHRGLSMLLVDMDLPGVEVRGIRQMTGGASFSEVFLTDVDVARERVIGEIGAGWSIATATLGHERKAVGDRSHETLSRALGLLATYGLRHGSFTDQAKRRQWASAQVAVRASRLRQQAIQSVPDDQANPAERTLDKVLTAMNLAAIGELAQELLGPEYAADTGEWGTFAWNRWRMGALGYRIAGGTEEVLKTLIAERELGLPREPKLEGRS
jgi:alkylation response protein AidB-like acyl-CoA dehydrogenase